MDVKELNNELGNIDLYLLDQILKGRIKKTDKILDAGCGEGRNLFYFLNNDYDVYGLDKNEDAIRMLDFIIGSKYPSYNKQKFKVGSIESMPFDSESFDYLICSAVLHFAENEEHFRAMMNECLRVTKPGGSLFFRMASDIGLVGHIDIGNGKYELPDGSVRFLLTLDQLNLLLNEHPLEYQEPIKTVRVENKRCMSTLVFRKS